MKLETRRLALLALPVLLAVGVGFAATSEDEADPPVSVLANERAEQLVDNWIDALGGLEAYWPLQSARYTLTTEIYDTESGRLRRT